MVRVTWLDAWLDGDAEVPLAQVEDNLKLAVDIAGFVKKTKKAVCLASNYDPSDGYVRFITKIPMSLVLEISISTAEETVYSKRGAENAERDGKEAQETGRKA